MNLNTLSKISIALYLISIGLLIISAYTQGRGIDPNPWQMPAYISLAIAAVVGIYLNLLRKKERDNQA